MQLVLVLLGDEPLFLDLWFNTCSSEQELEMGLPDRIKLSEDVVCKIKCCSHSFVYLNVIQSKRFI